MRRLLIANRGEIAVRIIRTAREMGIETIAIASEADREAQHARMADELRVIGPAPAQHSYLNVDAVLRAAIESKADAVHPGYGFLSESAAFARRVFAEGFDWVGPDPGAIELMGDKAAAIRAAREAEVPTLPGTGGALHPGEDAAAIAASIGYPIAIKASAGGGGRGIRIAHQPDELARLIDTARAEARAAFGDDEVYLERFITRARHVEVQVLGDGEQAVHLGGRDCSMQRRNQKVLEEAGVPGMPGALAERMYEAALKLTRRVRYLGAGTVEFLYDPEREQIAFIEMNTRLQVEHPVTEALCGIDLVREQLRIARGERLGYGQEAIQLSGHAIELRVNAEDPARGFLPSPGRIEAMHLAGGPGVRCDFGYGSGDTVAPFYDSLLGKIIVWAPDRERAITRAMRALGETRIEGVQTTLPLGRALVAHETFRRAEHSTRFIESASDLLEGMTP